MPKRMYRNNEISSRLLCQSIAIYVSWIRRLIVILIKRVRFRNRASRSTSIFKRWSAYWQDEALGS